MATNSSRKRVNRQDTGINWKEILRLDESYTSLLLGIFVVLIGALLLITFFNTKHQQSMLQATSSISTGPLPSNIPLTLTATPSVSHQAIVQAQPSIAPTITTQIPQIAGDTYEVKSGDDLWHIAEAKYGSGYNYVDIAQANDLADPSVLYAGTVLKLPQVPERQVTQIAQTMTSPTQETIRSEQKITGTSYTVQHGDDLWNIAMRAYGDGYQWTKIAQANNLSNPSLIFSGNVLNIPR